MNNDLKFIRKFMLKNKKGRIQCVPFKKIG